jgi:hypothetical protein
MSLFKPEVSLIAKGLLTLKGLAGKNIIHCMQGAQSQRSSERFAEHFDQ